MRARSSVRQLHLERAEIFLEPREPLGAGNRDHVRALCQQPRQHELGLRAADLERDRFDARDEVAIVREVVAGKARMARARIALGQALGLRAGGGEQPAAERRVRDQRNAERARRRPRLFGLGAVEQRIFVLHRGDRMHLVGAADGVGLAPRSGRARALCPVRRASPWPRPYPRSEHSDRCGADSRDRSPRRRGA